MEPAILGQIQLDECLACGGVWLDIPTFHRIFRSAEAQADALHILSATRGSSESLVRYLHCPVCNQQMARRNYARHSGVIVDSCPDHGLWFDRDELRRVVDFIKAGGLEDAAEIDAERTQALLRSGQPGQWAEHAYLVGGSLNGILDLLTAKLRR